MHGSTNASWRKLRPCAVSVGTVAMGPAASSNNTDITKILSSLVSQMASIESALRAFAEHADGSKKSYEKHPDSWLQFCLSLHRASDLHVMAGSDMDLSFPFPSPSHLDYYRSADLEGHYYHQGSGRVIQVTGLI